MVSIVKHALLFTILESQKIHSPGMMPGLWIYSRSLKSEGGVAGILSVFAAGEIILSRGNGEVFFAGLK